MFVRDASRTYGNKISHCKLLTESYRDKNGIPRHRTILNLSRIPQSLAHTIEQQVAGKRMVSLDEIIQSDNRSLGEVTILYRLAQRLGLIRILEEKLGKQIASLVLAMVINRVSLPKSRYSLIEWLETNYLPEIVQLSLDEFHHNRLYHALFKLTAKQQEIEGGLWEEAKKHQRGLRLMLYDITSTYLEGEQCELAAYGYNRDGKKGKKQLVIALVTTPAGRPVTVEVLVGNTADKSTLETKVGELRERFCLEEVIYVFDRGMRDEGKLAVLHANHLKYITALTRGEINELVQKGIIQLGLFDQEIAEYHRGRRRYVVCRSDQWERNKIRREELLKKTEEALEGLRQEVAKGRVKDVVKIARKAERKVRQWKMAKYLSLRIEAGTFAYDRRQEAIRQAEDLDGVYVLETTEEKLKAEEVRDGYKNLGKVEADFRTIKSILEVRPVHHRKAETVRGHVFVCFLALYLRAELEVLLEPLFKKHQEVTFSRVLTKLREIRQSRLETGGYQTVILNRLDELQQEILSTLGMRVMPFTK